MKDKGTPINQIKIHLGCEKTMKKSFSMILGNQAVLEL